MSQFSLHEYLPNISKLHFIFILATQRSGSTLLCQDLSQFHRIGNPKEYFLSVFSSKAKDPEIIEKFIRSSTQSNQHVFALKVMENYLDSFINFCRFGDVSDSRKSPEERAQFFSALASEAANISIIFLERNSLFDQTFSHFRAKRTGTWHSTDKSLKSKASKSPELTKGSLSELLSVMSETEAQLFDQSILHSGQGNKASRISPNENLNASVADTPSLNKGVLPEFLSLMAQTESQRRRLRELHDVIQVPSHWLSYDQIIDPERKYLMNIANYLNMTDKSELSNRPRQLSKLTGRDEVEKARRTFQNLLGI